MAGPIRWVRAAEAPGAPAGAEPQRARPAEPAARGAEGVSAVPGAAALVAMCSQLWFLTDRRIREDYPQVQIMRALRQRCSEQDVRFRAVLMDQIAVTVVGGHLGERGGTREGREARRGPREPAGWARSHGPPAVVSPWGPAPPAALPAPHHLSLEKAPNLDGYLPPAVPRLGFESEI